MLPRTSEPNNDNNTRASQRVWNQASPINRNQTSKMNTMIPPSNSPKHVFPQSVSAVKSSDAEDITLPGILSGIHKKATANQKGLQLQEVCIMGIRASGDLSDLKGGLFALGNQNSCPGLTAPPPENPHNAFVVTPE